MASKHAIHDISSPDPAVQLAALRRLKNEAIGHLKKREALLKAGILPSLARLLNTYTDARRNGPIAADATAAASALSSDAAAASDDMSYQALVLVASLASGGSAFVPAIAAAGLPSLLIACLSLPDCHDRLLSAALKAILALIEAASSCSLDSTQHDEVASICLSKSAINAYSRLLSAKTQTLHSRQQTSLICQILDKTVRTDQQRTSLEQYGLVDRLTPYVASYYAHNHPNSSYLFNIAASPLPSPPSAHTLTHLLGALDALVANSRYRVATLLFSPAIYPDILPFAQGQARIAPKLHQPAQQSAYDVTHRIFSLPMIHSRIEKADSASFTSAFPALGSTRGSGPGRGTSLVDFADVAPTPDNRATSPMRGSDSAFVSWLMHVMRTTNGLCRVKAAGLLVSIVKAGYVSASKDRSLALLVVPLLVEVLKHAQYANGSLQGAPDQKPFQSSEHYALCETPRVLAGLLDRLPSLQKAAVEAGVIKELCQFLKNTFGPIEAQPPLWSASPDTAQMDEELQPHSTLGDQGVSSHIVWLYRCRQHGLLLLAALASKEDLYRKRLCENGMIQCIIDSLISTTATDIEVLRQVSAGTKKDKLDAKRGNPEPILLAACKAAKYMARSVSLMRTSLVDAALAKPVWALVSHENPEVKIEATSVICNLIMEFSPMRHDIVEAGAVKLLCQHTHDANARLRSVSLWALKHLVSQAPNEVKQSCIEELGTGYLDQMISGSTSAASPAKPQSVTSGANARGEQVDILLPVEDEPMNDSGDPSPLGTSFATVDSSRSLRDAALDDPEGSTPPAQRQRQLAYLAEVKRAEEEAAAQQPRLDDVGIQVHALDFLRNVTTGPGNNDMIDFLYQHMGSQRIYDIIGAKLRPLSAGVSAPTLNPDAAARDMAATHQPAKLLVSTIYLLSHIAASAPKNRQHLVMQTNLMGQLRPFLRHPDQEVRTACLWVAINLMWVDDMSDQPGARQRQQELARLGFRDDIRARLDDSTFDVAERARTAWDLIEGRAQGVSGGGSGVRGGAR